jgi:hypothetical protein
VQGRDGADVHRDRLPLLSDRDRLQVHRDESSEEVSEVMEKLRRIEPDVAELKSRL